MIIMSEDRLKKLRMHRDTLKAREFILLRDLEKKAMSTGEILKKSIGDTEIMKALIRKNQKAGNIKMIKQGRKYPYQLTKKGKEKLKLL